MPRPVWISHPSPQPKPGVTRSKGYRLQDCIPNVAILDGSVGWMSLPTMAARTELRRHTALILGRGRGQRNMLEDNSMPHPLFWTARETGQCPMEPPS